MKIEFKSVNIEHLEMLREWRNSPRIAQNMYSQEYITESQQRSWFDGLSTNTTCSYFVCYVNEQPTGCLSFTDITDSTCSWGCYVGEPDVWVGTGIAIEAAALDYAFNHLKLQKLVAEVVSANKPPQRLHKMFGYDFIVEESVSRSGSDFMVKIYEYTHENWLIQRNKILGKLPPVISNAIQTISFLDKNDNAIYNYNHD
ncbi:TPA: UDP-4-amino-4,6-dideoxy-N-acetyl-beta-L-altrosamine N-acetyltransferase [Vibrio vulnificus]|nr:UDP-4-amino-4,6-dideoxy-N-acetyl-beta-L-altrosamine N-acetyltransferase [Vibrio vulnificus]HDY7469367.1 UDP-4-amino-4,6-dideoxy-N-acetyl-beta-L-altrosamine N-acetyltransferase [Vibrio vulnificus]HDY7735420.1 UDP-4-amino-4,6-dideoxy-N-acetyl-beta-L-altrosamine N-acetyltransferase [Vibrio vulnificus]HDY8145169.1 UDP-4-amino-4,6-dideoxy-N-acetyl-beta-L-altrosamine N-acetyltransferase [Vibrio vulnificus]